MRRYLEWLAIGATALALAGAVYVLIFGSAIVHDETGEVMSAVITNDHEEQALLSLPGGLFFAVPGLEGVIEVRCRNGVTGRAGYVTGYTHTSIRVRGGTPCRQILEEL